MSNERRLLDERLETAEQAYETAARDFLRPLERATHSGMRRDAIRAYAERSRDLGARLLGLYDLANEASYEWAKEQAERPK